MVELKTGGTTCSEVLANERVVVKMNDRCRADAIPLGPLAAFSIGVG
jgi:hypothetical protein